MGPGDLANAQLGQQHGKAAREQVYGTKAFYEGFFMKMAKLDWERVTVEAEKWKPFLDAKYPQYVEEMQGEYGRVLGFPAYPTLWHRAR